jgi:hypothetical protein
MDADKGGYKMDESFSVFMLGFMAVFTLFLLYAAWATFRAYSSVKKILKREGEMTAVTEGTIAEVVAVRRRNRSFRWINEYPVISYQVNGKTYTVHLTYAEKRRGKYNAGGSYRIHYVPSEPECCIVDDFKKKMKQSNTAALISFAIVAFFAFNTTCGLILQLLELVL